MANPNFVYGRPATQNSYAALLGAEEQSSLSSGPSGQTIIPGGLPDGTSGVYMILYWNGSVWTPATVDSMLRTWFNALSTSLPGTTQTFWNDGGLIAST